MDTNEIQEKIFSIVREITATDKLLPSDVLKNIGVDSLKMVSMIVELENAINVQIDDSYLDLEQIITIEDLINLVQKVINHE